MRFKYTPPINDWAVGRRQTVQKAFQWSVKREPRVVKASRMEFFKHDRMLWKAGVKPNRLAVGVIRAMGAPNFFRGAYHGAEND